MLRLLSVLLLSTLVGCFSVAGQTALQTSFESPYTTGSVNGQQGWSLGAGNATVSSSAAHSGTQGLQLSASGTALLLNYVAYAGSVPGITEEVYADMWINPASFATKGIAVNGYDLYGGSSKRIFVLEFGTDNKIKAYNGSSAVNVANWVAGQWVRLSVKMDFATEKYKVAVNGIVFATEMSFRETYTPTASGTRQAGVKEFHSLRFNHTNDTQTATSDASVDDIYVGKTPIADVSFGASSTTRTVTVTQPAFGTITLNPAGPVFEMGTTVTATLSLPAGYRNNGWTGGLTGTELSKTFTIAGNMSISADVDIDPANPPALYQVTLAQPANGTITLSPTSPDGRYYAETKVTATLSYEACYQFDGWTGALSGTQLSRTFTVTGDVNIGAAISPNTTPSVKRTVSTVTEFKNALAAMNPGDTIEVNDGQYNLSSTTVTRSGCAEKPIIIRAKNKGMAVLNGATTLVFRNVKYTTFQGFAFESVNIGTGIKLENCSRFRITQNSFKIIESSSCTWVYVGDTYASPEPLRSGYNRIDHNLFDGKTQAGNFIRMDGNINQQTQYDTIDHNLFRNNGPRAANEKESIRVGVSTLSKSSGFTIIEYNRFEDCDGDPEIVSIKSCDNIIRYNTFVRCLGTLCLRQGFRSVAEGNFFFGENKTAEFNGGTIGCGGIRVYGKDHRIVNNYFHGLTGQKWDAAMTITNGDVTNSSSSLAEHYLPENLVVAFNTFVHNQSNIEIGFDNNGNYPLRPVNCQFLHNVVVDSSRAIVKAYSTASLNGVQFTGNIFYPTLNASVGVTLPTSAITVADPKLMQPACSGSGCASSLAYKVWRLGEGSPAIDAASTAYPEINTDFEKQSRTGTRDIGADEYSGSAPVTVTQGALDSWQVGPDAIEYSYTYNPSVTLPARLTSFTAQAAGTQAELNWEVGEEDNVARYVVEWSDGSAAYTTAGTVAATGNAPVAYSYTHHSPVAGRNYYRLRIEDRDGRFSYSVVRTVVIERKGVLKILSNPVRNGKLALQFTEAVPAGSTLRLINLHGQTVRQFGNLQQGRNEWSLEGLAAGIYLAEYAEKGRAVTTERVILMGR
ncbi:MAG: polysaccharide lyase 6 family protein [Terrimonas ferruginea]|uniref:chondroitinase-B domain-containing protein n=1 Tax=Terrimonas ferruginea TaxID=249 RepID=UPI000AB35E1D|nr:chondroitinase-B domain-containing protein [Terrimonas ferruginea]MBN8782737.1 polysaccharide lyase 6 family protein [Terrimonas ferruginea]